MILFWLGWLAWLIIGALIALVAHLLTRWERRTDDVAVGMLGGVLGGVIFNQLGIPSVIDFNLWSSIGAAVGAVVLLAVFHAINRRWRSREQSAVPGAARTPAPTPAAESSARPTADKTGVRVYARSEAGRFGPVMRVGDRFVPYLAVLALLVALPLLDALLWAIRLPSISLVPPPFGTVEQYQGEAGTLDYVVYVPTSGAADERLPLVVLMHGCMQTPTILEVASGMTAVADANRFILVYPEQNVFTSPHRCWNWYSTAHQQRDSGEPALIAGIVGQVAQRYPTDPDRVYLAGISSGGAMTSIVATCYPDVFAAAAVHSGMAYESAVSIFHALSAPLTGSQVDPDIAGRNGYQCGGSPDRAVPVLVLHGRADTVVFPANEDDVIAQFAQVHDYADDGTDNDSIAPVPVSRQEAQVEDGHPYRIEQFTADGRLQRYSIDGLWHMWSGGTGVPPLSDPLAPNASQIFWDFFATHRLS
jgi:poly(hydroxyalkanoate) depolymerase family esterase